MADSSSEAHSDPGEPLRRWERIVALLIGTIFAVLAIIALFFSKNQAGTAALLLVAAAFLLIGVQGTALVRFGGGSASVELDRRAAAAVERADEVAKHDPELALGILEGAAMIEPRLGPAASALRSIAYENAVRRALERVLPDGGTVTATEPPADFAVLTPTANLLISVVFRRSRNIQMVDLAPLVSSRQLEGADGGLVVANQALSSGVSEYIATAAKHGVMIEVVNWDGPEHDRDLRQAVSRLLRQADPA